MLITRLAKIVMCLALGLFCLLIAFDNVTRLSTNYLFVQHVLSMDTTLPAIASSIGRSRARSYGN